MASRSIWKGAISFGLVHVPVALLPASSEGGIDFDWLDRRSMDPVGYKRINKRTGEEIASEHVVRGVKVEGGRYVVLGDDEIKAAYPRTTQTIEIETFVAPGELPFMLYERPYYLEPLPKGEKVYALLREALRAAGRVAVARVVLHTKEHLAVLAPVGAALVLHTLRWAGELRPLEALALPPDGAEAAALKDSELKMARQLIADMTEPWQPERYQDRFTQAVQTLVAQRAEAGQTAEVQPLESVDAAATSNVMDLTDLLQRSLARRREGGAAPAPVSPVSPISPAAPAAPASSAASAPRPAKASPPAAARKGAAKPARQRARAA